MIDIKKILDRAAILKIAVVGDLIQDNYLFGSVDRISPEAPVPVLHKQSVKTTLGGAANVFQNLINLGVSTELFCNFDGYPFWDQSLTDKIHCNPSPYSKKTRLMCGNHQLLRIDEELSKVDMPEQTFKQMSWWEYLRNKFEEYDAIVMVDYGKGVLSDSVINTIMEFSHITPKPVIVDAKKDFGRFRTASILKCNDKEFPMHGKPDAAGWFGVGYWVVTHGEKGISYRVNGSDQVIKLDGIPVNIVDVCGAGDTVTAALAIMVSEEAYNIGEAIEFANLAASEVVKRPGVYSIQKEDLLK